MQPLLIIVIIILVILIISKNVWNNYYKAKRNLQFAFSLPGTSLLLAIIHSLQFICNYKEFLNLMVSHAEKYESPSRFILGANISIVLTKPEDYKTVLTNVHGDYKSSVTKYWRAFLGDGIITISGAAHRLRRKALQPLFNIKHLSEYVSSFDNYSKHCTDLIEKNINGDVFDIKPYIARYVTDVFLETFVGIEGTAQKGKFNELLYWQERLMKLAYDRTIKPWLYRDWIYNLSKNAKQTNIGLKIVENFIQSVTSLKEPEIDPCYASEHNMEISSNVKSSFIKRFFHNVRNNEISQENLVDDVRNLYFSIQNTMTESTFLVLLMLAMHTEVQKKLREEILFVLGDEKVNTSNLSELKYLYMVINETLRLFPTVPMISRQLTEDIKLESCVLPKKCFVMIPIFAIHRNPMYWHDPEKFIPERFSNKNGAMRHRHTYLPFGTGLRNCLGQKYGWFCMTTIIVNLVRRFQFETTITDIKDIKLTTDILLRSRDNIPISIFSA